MVSVSSKGVRSHAIEWFQGETVFSLSLTPAAPDKRYIRLFDYFLLFPLLIDMDVLCIVCRRQGCSLTATLHPPALFLRFPFPSSCRLFVSLLKPPSNNNWMLEPFSRF